MFDDFKGGKINNNFWLKEGGVKEAWKVDKFQSDNRLEVHRIAGDGNGADDFGFGTIKFKDFNTGTQVRNRIKHRKSEKDGEI